MNLRVFYLYKTVGFGWLPFKCMVFTGKCVILQSEKE